MKFVEKDNIRKSFLKDFNGKTFRDDFSYDYKVVGLFILKRNKVERYDFILECVNNYAGIDYVLFDRFLANIKVKPIFFKKDYSKCYRSVSKAEFLNNFKEINL